MSTVKERAENDKKLGEIIPLVSNGNKDAETYLEMVAYSVRVIDDLHDQDHLVTKEQADTAFAYLFAGIPTNPFFVEHFATLRGIHAVAYQAWTDANLWMSGDEDHRRYASVIRDYINELCQVTALLTGGYEHMKAISLTVRESFIKEQ